MIDIWINLEKNKSPLFFKSPLHSPLTLYWKFVPISMNVLANAAECLKCTSSEEKKFLSDRSVSRFNLTITCAMNDCYTLFSNIHWTSLENPFDYQRIDFSLPYRLDILLQTIYSFSIDSI